MTYYESTNETLVLERSEQDFLVKAALVSFIDMQRTTLSVVVGTLVHQFPNLEILSFQYMDLPRLRKENFSLIPKLTHLWINNCGLLAIDDDAFADVHKLEALSIAGNMVTSMSLNYKCFEHLHLHYLNVTPITTTFHFTSTDKVEKYLGQLKLWQDDDD